jgi:hypothetical protein
MWQHIPQQHNLMTVRLLMIMKKTERRMKSMLPDDQETFKETVILHDVTRTKTR